jgi:hypothetical protein
MIPAETTYKMFVVYQGAAVPIDAAPVRHPETVVPAALAAISCATSSAPDACPLDARLLQPLSQPKQEKSYSWLTLDLEKMQALLALLAGKKGQSQERPQWFKHMKVYLDTKCKEATPEIKISLFLHLCASYRPTLVPILRKMIDPRAARRCSTMERAQCACQLSHMRQLIESEYIYPVRNKNSKRLDLTQVDRYVDELKALHQAITPQNIEPPAPMPAETGIAGWLAKDPAQQSTLQMLFDQYTKQGADSRFFARKELVNFFKTFEKKEQQMAIYLYFYSCYYPERLEPLIAALFPDQNCKQAMPPQLLFHGGQFKKQFKGPYRDVNVAAIKRYIEDLKICKSLLTAPCASSCVLERDEKKGDEEDYNFNIGSLLSSPLPESRKRRHSDSELPTIPSAAERPFDEVDLFDPNR